MKALHLVFMLFFYIKFLPGQCPDRNFLWNRIAYLKDSSVDVVTQLKELNEYENKITGCIYRSDSTHVLLLLRLGWLHKENKDYMKAIDFSNRAIKLAKANLSQETNKVMIVRTFTNIRIIYEEMGYEKLAARYNDSIISYSIKYKAGDNYCLNAILLKANGLFYNGDYYSSLYHIDMGESILKNAHLSDTPTMNFEYEFFNSRMNILRRLRQQQDAETLWQRTKASFEQRAYHYYDANFYSLYGGILKDKGDYRNSINYYKKAYAINKADRFDTGCAEALNSIGLIYCDYLSRPFEGRNYYMQALAYAGAEERMNIYDNIANNFVKEKKFDSAFYHFAKALNEIKPSCTDHDLVNKISLQQDGEIIQYRTGLLVDKGNAALEQYNTTKNKAALAEALRIYKLADQYFENIKNTQAETQSKLYWKKITHSMYEHAIEACYINNDVATAFYYFERSRSVLLNEQLKEQSHLSEGELATQAGLKKKVVELEHQLEDAIANNTSAINSFRYKLFEAKQEVGKFMKRSDGKQFYNTSVATLSFADLKKNILNPTHSLLELFYGDSAVYVLCVTTNNVFFKKIDKRPYDELNTAFINFLINPSKLNKSFAAFSSTSYQLYDLIFNNISLPANSSLIISPDGRNFPFEALITDKNKATYLLEKFATSYTYSASYLANQQQISNNKKGDLLGIAPVEYNNGYKLSRLPGSDLSLQNISNNFSSASNLVFKQATRQNFMQSFPDYRILQLYTHAADSSAGNDPVIYFEDSALYLADLIPGRRPSTRLVVLSACETANGRLYEGEGIFSFNRGFALWGIPAAVSNLWSVDNRSTYSITELFYKNISAGYATDVALQKAKLEFIRTATGEKVLPYYWAGPILTGKAEVIEINKPLPVKIILLIAAPIILSALGYFYFRRRSKPLKPAHKASLN